MKVSSFLVISVITRQQKREAYWDMLNQYMKVSSFLVINVILRQGESRIYCNM